MTPPQNKRDSVDRKPLRRVFKIVIGMLRCSSSQLMTSVRFERKDSVVFRGLATGFCPCSSEYMCNTNVIWSIFFLGVGHKTKRKDLGEIGSKYDWGALCKILK